MKFILFLLITFVTVSCQKFLDAKPDKKLLLPTSVTDVQALLDENYKMNMNNPAIGEISADDYYLPTTTWLAFKDPDRNAYVWDAPVYGGFPNDWSTTYDIIFNANVALEALKQIKRDSFNSVAWDAAKGIALMFRGKSFLQAAWIWANAYDQTTLNDPGIPLRLTSNFNEPSTRATVKETYDQIITDLKAAVALLPVTPAHVMRPSKPAAYGFLARAFLSMRQYQEAFAYADSALQLCNTLIDFNTLNTSAAYPLTRFNAETVFFTRMPHIHLNIADVYARIDTSLYRTYANDDLRKTVFFKSNPDGTHSFKGSYDGSIYLFNGIAVDELYLMRAEAAARIGKINETKLDINTLLSKRWKAASFTPISENDSEKLLNFVLNERRKELLMRDLRWMDIKRFNRQGAGIVLKRFVDGEEYLLHPNSSRYALPIPDDIINLTGMQQNSR